MKETIAQEALRLLEPIKSTKFITDKFTNDVDCCCAIGHYARLRSGNPDDYSLYNCSDRWRNGRLRTESAKYISSQKLSPFNKSIAHVNSTPIGKYQQKTPKARSIALLKDMIKEGY